MESHGFEMKGAISSIDGIETITITPVTGKVTISKDLEVDGVTQLDGDVIIPGGSPIAEQVLFTTDALGTLSYVHASVPSGETILFDEDVVVAGYTLETDAGDRIIYITKGSAAGGETGGSDKSGSTWTQPTHDHGGYTGYHSVTIAEMPAHRHTPHYPSSRFHVSGGTNPAGNYAGGNNRRLFSRTDYTGGSQGHRHTLSSLDSDGTPNTWRPYGRNLTRQTKN